MASFNPTRLQINNFIAGIVDPQIQTIVTNATPTLQDLLNLAQLIQLRKTLQESASYGP